MQTGTLLQFTKSISGTDILEGDKAVYLGNSQIRIITGNCTNMVFSLLISAPIQEIGYPEKTPFCQNCTKRAFSCTHGEQFEIEVLDETYIFCKSFNFFDKDKFHGE